MPLLKHCLSRTSSAPVITSALSSSTPAASLNNLSLSSSSHSSASSISLAKFTASSSSSSNYTTNSTNSNHIHNSYSEPILQVSSPHPISHIRLLRHINVPSNELQEVSHSLFFVPTKDRLSFFLYLEKAAYAYQYLRLYLYSSWKIVYSS